MHRPLKHQPTPIIACRRLGAASALRTAATAVLAAHVVATCLLPATPACAQAPPHSVYSNGAAVDPGAIPGALPHAMPPPPPATATQASPGMAVGWPEVQATTNLTADPPYAASLCAGQDRGAVVPANFVGGDEQRELIAGETTLPSGSGLEGTQPPTRPLHIRDQEPPLPLRRPGAGTTGASASNEALSSAANPLPSALTVGGSLMIVLSIFFVVAWAMRRAAPQSQVVLPGEVFEMLGRAPLSGRQQVHLLRLGRKLVLVSVTPAGAETLTEVTDADEVDRLAGMCHQAKPGSISASFRTVLEHFGEEFSRKAGTSAEPTGVESPRDQWSPGQWTRTRADAQREARDA